MSKNFQKIGPIAIKRTGLNPLVGALVLPVVSDPSRALSKEVEPSLGPFAFHPAALFNGGFSLASLKNLFQKQEARAA